MINDFFVPELEDVDVDDLWFQQDDATYHAVNESINLLKKILNSALSHVVGLWRGFIGRDRKLALWAGIYSSQRRHLHEINFKT